MRTRVHARRSLPVAAAVVFAAALVTLGLGPAWAGSPGQLQLRVARCSNGAWVSGAAVDVQIYHPSGGGPVAYGSGTTNGDGYVTINFSDLEDGDEAHVVVTPSGESSDSGHVFYWVDPDDRDAGIFDLGVTTDQSCTDDWFNQSSNIIRCRYNN